MSTEVLQKRRHRSSVMTLVSLATAIQNARTENATTGASVVRMEGDYQAEWNSQDDSNEVKYV